MRKAFRTALNQDILLADGAIGTLLVSRGASAEQAKSPLNLTDPAAVSEVHEDYLDAGARILTTNTWDANRVKLTTHEWADSLEKINREGVRLAREAASGEMAFVAASIGPLGALVKPYGQLTLGQVREIFEEQARALLDGEPDLIILETFGSMLEAAEAVRAVRGLSSEIPIVAQMTFLSDGRTAFGESASHALATLALAGADAVGMNCTLGPQETHDVFTRLGGTVSAPLSVMPNAGYPTVVHGRNVYLSSPDYLSDYAKAFVEAGAAIIGGCCGTTPEHIRSMARAIAGRSRVLDAAKVSVVLESVAHRVIAAIDPAKDVDGFHSANVGRLWSGAPGLVPCTPQACLLLLRTAHGDLTGAEAVVLGRSNIVGKPVAALLLAADCTVTMVHSKSRDAAAICRRADILIVATGRPQMVKAGWVKPGATVIDVGINPVADREGRRRVVGDVDFAAVQAVAGAITPVPGGVGPMTIACLLRNTLLAACRRRGLPDPLF